MVLPFFCVPLRGKQKNRLIYSSQGLGAATESNAGAVSTSAKNVGAETRGGTPTSDKSSGLSTFSVAQETDRGKKKSEPIRDEAAAYRHTLAKRNGLSAQIEIIFTDSELSF